MKKNADLFLKKAINKKTQQKSYTFVIVFRCVILLNKTSNYLYRKFSKNDEEPTNGQPCITRILR